MSWPELADGADGAAGVTPAVGGDGVGDQLGDVLDELLTALLLLLLPPPLPPPPKSDWRAAAATTAARPCWSLALG
jgi:hypothetical protein